MEDEVSIGLQQAQAIVAAAEERARQIGVPMNIAVMDGGGHLLAFARMDRAILGSIDIALAKAKTSVLFNGPSENLWEFCKPGGPAPATELTNGGLIPYAGGVAINDEDGSLLGAIGVSGGLPVQDGDVARAGVAQLFQEAK
ncbi:heme-binding protein [Nocardia sp. NPDC059240]|uniref:GlcG/HbpS family heme-binding protein n=1 Tax=Nocardia sp. NPDC059240 TaxID=3346786 RepID=UPI0036C53904